MTSTANSTAAIVVQTAEQPAEDMASKAVNKRYEGLMMVRAKAIKGKGAWYWAHLEPILVKNPDTSVSKAVKLKCGLCDAVFSASNPSRTASEHLKRGTCPNFNAVSSRPSVVVGHSLSPLPLSSIPSPSVHVSNNNSSDHNAVSVCNNNNININSVNHHHSSSNNYNRKRSKNQQQQQLIGGNSLAIVESKRYELTHSHTHMSYDSPSHAQAQAQAQHLVLSGGKDDLGPLAMLEDSVKKLKSPKTKPGPVLNKDQVDSAVELLADWFYDSYGSVSFSSLDHPKFRAFLGQVGLPLTSRREVLDARLDLKFVEAKTESEARVREAMFLQVASDGWKTKACCGGEDGGLVKFMVNLPNGTSVYQKAVITGGAVGSKYAEEILWETVMGICGSGNGNGVQRCVGIIADKFKGKALRNLEVQNQWMVNLSCQLQGFVSLIKDFSRELPVFRRVSENCLKIADFVNSKPQIRNSLRKCKMGELECVGLIRVPSSKCDCKESFVPVMVMLEDILSSARVLNMVVLDDSVKDECMDDPVAGELVGLIQNEMFWNELDAVYSLVKLVKGMAQEIEVDRPLIGQCIPLWEELRSKVKSWCTKFSISEEPVEKIIEKRFRKNYHPAWSAAFILDPLYLMRENSGKYLPPFKCLTQEQEKDVDKLITRLVSREEAHFALMELMKWRSEGLDPLYAQAVQVKQRDPMTGKMKIANPQSSRLVWETCLSEYKSLGKVAVRLIFLHATSFGFKCNWSFTKWVCLQRNSRTGLERVQKMMFVAAHAKLERRDFSNEEEKDAEMFTTSGGEDDMLNEVFADASSM